MTPEIPIQIPEPIPVSWGWLQVLSTLTFVVHLLLVSTVMGLTVISFVNRFKKRDEHLEDLNKSASSVLPFIIAFAVNMGVPPLLFYSVLWGHVGYVSTVLMAVWWLSVIAALIIAYYVAYAWKKNPRRSSTTALLGMMTVLFMLVAFIFANNMTLAQNPQAWSSYFENPGGTLLNLGDPTLLPRYLHFIVGSIAIGGLATAVIWNRKQKDPTALSKVNTGMRWFFAATCLQVPVGTWFLLSQPERVFDAFLGGNLAATVVLGLALVLTASLLVSAWKKKIVPTAIHLVMLVGAMAVCREFVRRETLGEAVAPETAVVRGEYGPMILFVVALALGIAAVFYLLRTVQSSGERNEVER